MSPPTHRAAGLTKRERQIMDVLYQLGRATASEVQQGMPGTPSYSTIRTQLRVLETKGHVQHEEVGLRYVYTPTVPRHAARKMALRHLIDTFFDGSAVNLVTTLLGKDAAKLTDEELERIARLARSAKGQ